MNKLRIRFKKTESARYLSHLDLMRTFARAFARSGITVRQTEGFNPHAYVSIALPLQLGCESECEILDTELLDETPYSGIPDRLNPFLPEGITVDDAYEPVKKPAQIKFAQYRSKWIYDRGTNEQTAEKIRVFFASGDITILKKTKSGESEINLAPHIIKADAACADSRTLILDALVSAQNPTVNPSHLLKAVRTLLGDLNPSFSMDCRTYIFDETMKPFR
jgi:radical SAM-linked protein